MGKRRAGETVSYRNLLDLYEWQLRGIGYLHADDSQRALNSNGSTIYHIIFASKHPKGAELFAKICKTTHDGQRRMF
jgi:hypothetical protein